MAQQSETTETGVANRALSLIKKPAISSIDEDTSNACQVVKKHFAATRDALQRRYPWNCCESFALLSASAPTPIAKFSHGYTLPADCLAVREVIDADEDDWKLMKGRRLVINKAGPITIRYTARTVEVAHWDALFASAFAQQLALAIAPELASDATTVTQLREAASDLLEGAFPSDAAESGGDALEDTDWVTGR